LRVEEPMAGDLEKESPRGASSAVDYKIALFAVYLAVLQSQASRVSDYLGLEWSLTKAEYGQSFGSFFPFYVSQHQDDTCVLLHVVATGVLLVMCVKDYRVALSMGLSALAGLSSKELSRSLSHGFVEMAIMQGIFLMSMLHMKAPWTRALGVPAVCYGLAWVGHFFFERNRPATFVYPVYSLLGDWKLFANYLQRLFLRV
jgi:hypothetical protein